MSDRIKVAVKVRPLIEREKSEGLSLQWKVKDNTIYKVDKKKEDSYTFVKQGGTVESVESPYIQNAVKLGIIQSSHNKSPPEDYVFDETTKNDDVFKNMASPIVESAVGGFNGTIFAYGQTSSGKTFTMMGNSEEPGIIPLTIDYIFRAVNNIRGREFLLRASYMEIYNEKVHDLLEKGKAPLKLREGPDGSVAILNLKEELVHTPSKNLAGGSQYSCLTARQLVKEMVATGVERTYWILEFLTRVSVTVEFHTSASVTVVIENLAYQIMNLMRRGEKIRQIGETNMNERSSRSHTIFRIIIESHIPNDGEDGVVQVSHLNLVDLAGSERVDQTGARGERLKEGCAINRSLFMLSHVIAQLSEGQDQYVNFRDSKLTRILQSSLGGNALTAIICAVTPAAIEETASTLGFAMRAINVKMKPHVNEVLSDAALMRRYKRQIARLQDELQKAKTGNGNEEVKEINKLQEQLKQHELFKERLQDRINLLQTMVLGSTKVDTDMERRRALRRRTWCGNSLKQAAFASNFEAISEESITYDVEDLQQPLFLNSSVKDLANNDLFDTPLEEFELQLIGDQNAFSSERLESPDSFSNITCRNPRGHRVRFEESIEQMENVPVCSKSVDASVQTEACPTNILLQRAINCGETAFSTPPPILRERINYFQREYDELREFTTLEKQIFDNISYKQVECLEKENKTMQRTMVDQENMLLDLNSKISNLTSENKLLREQLEFKTKKNTELTNKLLPLGDMENTLTAKQVEVGELQKKLKVAAQRIQILENEKSDFDMTWKLAENKLQLRITELTQSLQEAWNELDNQCSNNVDTNAQSESDKRNNDRPQTHGHPGTTNSLEKLTNVNEFSDSYEQLKQNYGYVNKELVRKMQEIDTLNMKVRELSSKENSSFGNIEMLATNPEVISSEKKSIPETIHDIKQMELKQSNIEDFVKIYEELNNKYNYVNEELSNNVKENYILKLKVEELLIAVKDSGSKDTEILAISHEESMSKKEIVADKETVCHLETLQFDLDNHSDTKEFMEMYNHFKQKLDYVNKELGEKLKEIDILKFQVQDLINGKEKNVKCTQILTEQEDVTLPERETDTMYKEIQCNLGTYVDMHLYVTLKDKYEVLKHNSDLINGELSKKVREIGSLKLQIQELVSEKDTCLKCKRNREEIILENKAISDVGEMQCPHETVTDNLDEQTGTVEFKKNYNQLKESYDYVNEELGKKVTEIEKLNSQIQELVSERQATHTEISTGKHEVISTENVINTKYEERECHSDTLDERCLNKSLGLESENTCKSLLMKENCALKKENVLYVEQLKEKEKAMKLLMDRIEEISVEKEVSNNEKDIKISKNNKDELNLMSSKLFPGYFGVELIKRLESEIVDLHEQSLECSNILEKVKTELQKLEISEQYEMENYDYISETSSNLNAGLKEVYQTILIKIKQFEEFKLNYRNTSALFEANKNLVKQLESTAHDLSEKLNAEISKSDLLNCQLQELTGFSNPCDILDSNIIAELETTKKKLFINIREIDVCRRVIVKEIKSLNPECDIEWNSDLSEQLKTLLDLIMEKEAELISHLQLESEKLRREMNENSRAFADKDRRRNIWVTELETEIQSMQSEFSKEIDKMKENIKILQEERNDLLNKIKQFESDSALVKTLKGERDDLTAEVQSYQNKLAYIKDLEKERNMLITNAKQFEEDLARIEILREKELVTLKLEQDENDSLHKALEEQRAELLKKSQQSEHVSSYIKGLKEEQDDLIRKSENDLSHIKVLNDEKAELKRKLHQAVTDLDLVKLDMHNLCSTNKTITEELNSIKLLLQQKDTKISHLCNELHHLEELENSLSCLNEQLKNSNIEIATLKECLLDLKSKHSQLTELIRNKDQELIEKDIILSDLNKKLEYKIEKSNKIRNELMIQIETMEENVADLKSENSKLMETLRNKEEDITQKNIELSELNSKLEVQIQESNKAKRELELHIDRLKINFTNLNSKFENKDKELIQNSCDQHKKLEDQIEQSNKTKNELKMQLKTLEEILTNMNLKNSKQNQLLQDKDKEIIEKNILLSELHKKLEDQLQQSNKTKAELKVQIKTLEGDIVDLKSRILQPMKLIENKEIKDVPSVQHKATDGEQYSKNKCYALAYSSEMEDTMLCQNNKIFVLQEEINFLKEEIVIEKNKNSEFMEILETKVTEIKECNKKLEHKNTEHLEIKNQLNIIILDLKESSKKNAVLHKSNEELLKTNSLLEKKVKELKEKNRLLVEENKNAISHIEDFNLIYEKLKETPVKDVTKCSVATATDITGCQCTELSEKLQQSKLSIEEQNSKIASLELQINNRHLPFQKKILGMEENVAYYKNQDEISNLQRELQEKERDMCILKNLCQKRQSSIATLEKKLENLSHTIERSDDIDDCNSIKEMELNALKLQLSEALKKNEYLDAENEDMLNKINEQEKIIEEMSQEILFSESQTTQEKLKESEKELVQLNSQMKDEISNLQRELQEKERDICILKNLCQERQSSIATLEKKLENLSHTIERSDDIEDCNSIKEMELNALKLQLSEALKKNQYLDAENEDMLNKFNEQEEIIEEMRQDRLFSESQTTQEKFKKESEKKLVQLNSQMKDEISDLQSELQEKERDICILKNLCQERQSSIATLEKKLENLSHTIERSDDIEDCNSIKEMELNALKLQLSKALEKNQYLDAENEDMLNKINELEEIIEEMRQERLFSESETTQEKFKKESEKELVQLNSEMKDEISNLQRELQEKERDICILKNLCQERQSSIATLEKKLENLSHTIERSDDIEDCNSIKEMELNALKLQLSEALEKNQYLDAENEDMLNKINEQEEIIEEMRQERLFSESQTTQEKFKKENEREQVQLNSQLKVLTGQVEDLTNDRQLMDETEGPNHYSENYQTKYTKQKPEQISVPPKCSPTTLTNISGCQCLELAEKLQQSKLTIVECNTKIASLELQIKTEEFPFQKKEKEMEANLAFYRNKNSELKTELRTLQRQLHESRRICESCVRRKSLTLKSVSVQVDFDDAFVDYGGSGIVREDTLFKLRIRIREQDTLIATLKNLCRDRRKKVLALESQLQCSSKAEGRIPRPSVHAEIQTDSTYLQDYKLQKMENIRYLQRENSLLNKACQQKQNEAHKLEKSVSRNTAPLSTLDQNPEIRESQHKKKDI